MRPQITKPLRGPICTERGQRLSATARTLAVACHAPCMGWSALDCTQMRQRRVPLALLVDTFSCRCVLPYTVDAVHYDGLDNVCYCLSVGRVDVDVDGRASHFDVGVPFVCIHFLVITANVYRDVRGAVVYALYDVCLDVCVCVW